MIMKQLVSFLDKFTLLAPVDSVSLLTAASSASPIGPGFDLFTSNDALGNSVGAATCPPIPGDMADSISKSLNHKGRR